MEATVFAATREAWGCRTLGRYDVSEASAGVTTGRQHCRAVGILYSCKIILWKSCGYVLRKARMTSRVIRDDDRRCCSLLGGQERPFQRRSGSPKVSLGLCLRFLLKYLLDNNRLI